MSAKSQLAPYPNCFDNAFEAPNFEFRLAVTVPQDRRVRVILILLEQNSHRQLAIADVARAVNLSPGRLAHLFKSEVGVSLQQYLTQIRLAKAKHQLETTFLSIKEIAAANGFPSVTRFTASFKETVGATPSEYRKHCELSHSLQRKNQFIARSADK